MFYICQYRNSRVKLCLEKEGTSFSIVNYQIAYRYREWYIIEMTLLFLSFPSSVHEYHIIYDWMLSSLMRFRCPVLETDLEDFPSLEELLPLSSASACIFHYI